MLLYCIILIFLANYALATIREIEINLSLGVIDPDCYGQGYEHLLADGQYPGPPIRLTKGDEVRVTVRNAENSNRMTTIHFHGIFQIGTTEADGFPGVTQAEIPPGGVFQQNFRVIDQTGTYFYHAHSGLQEGSVYGSLIVYETDNDWPSEDRNQKLREGPYEYDDELILLLSDWWHQDEKARLDWMLGKNFDVMTDPESYLINGHTIFDTSNVPENCNGYSVFDVEPGKTYRLRVIGSQTFSGMNIAIESHMFTIIEVDGVPIKPYQTDYLPVTTGQRFSALLSTNQAPDNYKIAVKPFNTNTPKSNGLAFLRYNQNIPYKQDHGVVSIGEVLEDLLRGLGIDIPSDKKLPGPPASSEEEVIDKSYFHFMEPLNVENTDFAAPPDRTIVLTPVETRLSDNTTRWLINNRLAPEYDPPLIMQLGQMNSVQLNSTAIGRNKAGLGDGYDEGHQTFPMRIGEVVDIVLHATILHYPNICVGHPWHSHGMVHYPIANGPGEYVHKRDKYIRTYATPIAKDTTYVYQYPPTSEMPSGTPCGWMKLRFFVKNPGLWGLHCHITGHMLQGMMVVLEVSPEQIPILQRK
ncbi:Cupredoxin [Fennellomyces sp. T-0311]|nr:Cupredoxin [Fennellomyces sp. T-0311]